MKLVLLSVCLVLSSVRSIELEEHSQESEDLVIDQSTNNGEVDLSLSETVDESSAEEAEDGRSIGEAIFEHHRDQHEMFEKKAKPLRNVFLGIYKNYKSTYLGNRTSSQYRKMLRDRHSATTTTTAAAIIASTEETPTSEATQKLRKKKKKRRRNKKKRTGAIAAEDPLIYTYDEEYRYKVGPGVNMSLDMRNDIVSVNLDEDCLKDILLGRWNDPEVEGRGKKYEMISKILPLFILPFLIQSAIIPFLVTKLKLLLVKSILIGKLAIFLLVVSALKNNSKSAPTYEVAPSYWAGEPSRRSEATAAYNGYRVEGRPTTWIN